MDFIKKAKANFTKAKNEVINKIDKVEKYM